MVPVGEKQTVSARWESTATVDAFSTAPPNEVLLRYAQSVLGRGKDVLDIGCGAARNALPLAQLGFSVVGTDLSAPMVDAARLRHARTAPQANVSFLLAPMAPLPFPNGCFDLVVAHGVWNLARSDAELRHAVQEAARVARPGAGLFLFTFSRDTLPIHMEPVAGESMTFTQFSGEPMVFMTQAQVFDVMAQAGFFPDPPGPLTEYNQPLVGTAPQGPVIFEGTFVRRHAEAGQP